MNSLTPAKTRQAVYTDALLGSLPFLAYILVSLWLHFGDGLLRMPIWLHPFLVFDTFVLIGLGAGLLGGIPRWTYSYLAWAVILAWWLSDMGIYGTYHLDSRMWLPLLGVFLLALLVHRGLSPIRDLLSGLWRDRTLFGLGIYTFLAWQFVMYDENHHPYLLFFILAATLAACVGAWFYFRLWAAMQKISALLAGLAIMLALSIINEATWDWRAYYNLPESAGQVNPVGVLLLITFVLLMVLAGYLTKREQKSLE